jgi:RNA polymerase sigma-70 factor, ECF subfamily
MPGRSDHATSDSVPACQERQALDEFYNATYRELHRLAKAIKRADSKATISTTTLVHETWVRLAKSGTLTSDSRQHLKRIVAQAMRQFVVEAARRRRASKRGGGAAVVITLDESVDLRQSPDDQGLLALDAALEDLARLNSRQASLIELRFFGGLDVAEAAGLLGVSESTALRDWRVAKAWLASQIHRGA